MIPNPDVEQLRFNMIEQQIRPWDVLDLEVLDLLAQIRREDYVPKAHRSLARSPASACSRPRSRPACCRTCT
jgi:protein-L-isoaspartate(D-aspartate) O-methyltransferase